MKQILINNPVAERLSLNNDLHFRVTMRMRNDKSKAILPDVSLKNDFLSVIKLIISY